MKIKQSQIDDIQKDFFDVSANLKEHTDAIEANLRDDRKNVMERDKGGIFKCEISQIIIFFFVIEIKSTIETNFITSESEVTLLGAHSSH